MENLQVSITLTVSQINQLLLIITERPLKEVIDLFTAIRAQGDAAVQRAAALAAEGTQSQVRAGTQMPAQMPTQEPQNGLDKSTAGPLGS